MSELEMREVIRTAVKSIGSLREAARRWNVSAAHLSDCLNGRRRPGPAVLKHVGYERIVTVDYRSLPREGG